MFKILEHLPYSNERITIHAEKGVKAGCKKGFKIKQLTIALV